MRKKKNNSPFIIPASYFRTKGIHPIKVDLSKATSGKIDVHKPLPKETTITKEEESVDIQLEVAEKLAEQRPKIILNKEKVSSGLSLSSIKKKKEFQIRQMEVILDEDELPKESFTQEELSNAWNDYAGIIEKKGQFNLASILRMDSPKMQESIIHLELPNSTNKVELERQKTNLLRHLRTTLNNFDIDLSISINESLEKQYAYTPQEKYKKLKDKNKSIDLLRKTFDLDL